MYTSQEERDELSEMREAVRYTVESLDLCWSCQRISECEFREIDDGPAVPLCRGCVAERDMQTGNNRAQTAWPAV